MHSDSGQTLTWHEDCLQCSVCQVKVQLDNVVFSDKLFCRSCYIETNLNKCDKCSKVGVYYCIVIQCHLYFFLSNLLSQVITGSGYTFRGKFWHDTCFGCDRCENIFQDGKFRILREEKLCDICFKSATQS